MLRSGFMAVVLTVASAATALSTPETFILTGSIRQVDYYYYGINPVGFYAAHVGDALTGTLTVDPATFQPDPAAFTPEYSIAGDLTLTDSGGNMFFNHLGGSMPGWLPYDDDLFGYSFNCKRLTNPGMRSAASGRAASGSEVGNLAEGASIQAWEHVREIFLHGRA